MPFLGKLGHWQCPEIHKITNVQRNQKAAKLPHWNSRRHESWKVVSAATNHQTSRAPVQFSQWLHSSSQLREREQHNSAYTQASLPSYNIFSSAPLETQESLKNGGKLLEQIKGSWEGYSGLSKWLSKCLFSIKQSRNMEVLAWRAGKSNGQIAHPGYFSCVVVR